MTLAAIADRLAVEWVTTCFYNVRIRSVATGIQTPNLPLRGGGGNSKFDL